MMPPTLQQTPRILTLYYMGGGSHEPPLAVISCHFVGNAPNNPKFLDFYQFDPYFHLVKSFFTFFGTFTKISVKIFFRPKKEQFFDGNFFAEITKNSKK